MTPTRRIALLNLLASVTLLGYTPGPYGLGERRQEPQPQHTVPIPPNPDEDVKLPNGKSQKDAIAKQNHEQSMKDVNELISIAEQLRDELQKSGEHVVSVSSVKKTEDIERLARKIRGRLKS